jgi:hypothetical protein
MFPECSRNVDLSLNIPGMFNPFIRTLTIRLDASFSGVPVLFWFGSRGCFLCLDSRECGPESEFRYRIQFRFLVWHCDEARVRWFLAYYVHILHTNLTNKLTNNITNNLTNNLI